MLHRMTSPVSKINTPCFGHLTKSMAQSEGDFGKGEEFGSIDKLALTSYIIKILGQDEAAI
jgi:hypothetical protein